jgi:serine/threonine-protein kinase HipA
MATTRKFQTVDVIKVYAFDRYVGAVALDPIYGYYVFAYDKKFLQSGIELSPLQMPLAKTTTPILFSELPEATYQRLPALLADSLPDDFGNALINRYMADQGILASQISALDRLAYMGTRAMGALEFRPQHGPRSKKTSAIELGELVLEARKAITGEFNDADHTNATLRSIIEVGTSAGGARAKAVVAWNPSTNEIRSGQTLTPEGFEHWLLKFDGVGLDRELGASANYGRIEYAYHLMALHAGINMMPCRLLEENGRAHFMTKRFDRTHNNQKLHMQTLCAMAHLDYKKKSTNSYAQLLLTIKALELPRADLLEAYRRMIFNALAKNCDDHTKNFSFLLPQDGQWRLSPAYDVTFAHAPNGEWTAQHLMSINGKFKDFNTQDFMEIADRFGIGEAKKIIREVAVAVQAWPEFANAAGISEHEKSNIAQYHLSPA